MNEARKPSPIRSKTKRVLLWLIGGPKQFIAALLLLGVPTLMLTRTEGDSGAGSIATTVVQLALLGIVLVGLVALAFNLAGADPDAEDRARSAAGDDPLRVALLGRWLRRSRHFRFVGGLVGFVLQVGWWTNGMTLEALSLGVLGGVAIGGALAEVHSWRRRGSAKPRSADLVRRRLADYARPVDLGAMSAIAIAGSVLALWALIGSGRRTDLLAAGTAIVVMAILVGFLHLLVNRPRPALDPDLRQADELMRRLAATQGFTRPGIAVGLALIAVAADASGVGWPVVVGLWLAGFGWYVASRQSDRNLRAAAI